MTAYANFKAQHGYSIFSEEYTQTDNEGIPGYDQTATFKGLDVAMHDEYGSHTVTADVTVTVHVPSGTSTSNKGLFLLDYNGYNVSLGGGVWTETTFVTNALNTLATAISDYKSDPSPTNEAALDSALSNLQAQLPDNA